MYRHILHLMSQKRIDLTPVVTHHFPIERIRDGFNLVLSKDKSAIGIVLDWAGARKPTS
jgi:threonine dehydrogenase-like Zn-dependent dehydrogenase